MRTYARLGLLLSMTGLALTGARNVAGADKNGPGASQKPHSAEGSSSKNSGPANPDYPKGFIVEGPLPDGFPPPSEAGRIVEKTYPICRTFSAEGNRAFSRCFVYLVLHKHEMTAPVIMDYKHREPRAGSILGRGGLDFLDVQRMHFVLENPSLDQPKREGLVEVADIPRLRVLSLAYQGQLTDEELKRAEGAIAAEIGRRPGLIAAGPPRILGYNSPMVPKDRTYWEIQVPVESRKSPATEARKS